MTTKGGLFQHNQGSRDEPSVPLSFTFPVSKFRAVALDGVRLSLLFVFVISLSFTPRVLTLATAEQCSVTAFSRATKRR